MQDMSKPSRIAEQPSVLIEPDMAYSDEYLAMLREHQALGRFLDSRHVDNNVNRIQRNFAGFITSLKAASDPLHVRPGYLPEFHYWMVSGNDIVGRSTLRCILSDEPALLDLGHIGYDVRPSRENQGWGKRILAHTIQRAAELGLERVLLCCDSHNVASRSIIESCGGEFEGARPIAGRPYERLRFWIDVSNNAFQSYLWRGGETP